MSTDIVCRLYVYAYIVLALHVNCMGAGVVSADFKEGLAGGLFVDDWAESRQVVDTLHITLQVNAM